MTIYDPLSGAKLDEHTSISSPTATLGDLSSSAHLPTAGDHKLWSSLGRTSELQAEIATMHAETEGVGGRGPGNNTGIVSVGAGEGGDAGPRKRSRRGQTLPIGDEEPEEREPASGATGRAFHEVSTDRWLRHVQGRRRLAEYLRGGGVLGRDQGSFGVVWHRGPLSAVDPGVVDMHMDLVEWHIGCRGQVAWCVQGPDGGLRDRQSV